jgi:hypothetical protein
VLKQHLPDAAARRDLPVPALLGCAHGPPTGHPAPATITEYVDDKTDCSGFVEHRTLAEGVPCLRIKERDAVA